MPTLFSVWTFLVNVAWPWFARVVGVCTALALAMRAVPEDKFLAFERAYPRLGQVARAVRKVGADLVPFLQIVRAIWLGQPVHPAQPNTEDSARPAIPPPPRVPMLALLTLAALLALLTAGCPKMPPPSGCPTGAQRCFDGVPQVCSPQQRWTPADQRCDRFEEVCCRVPSAYDPQRIVHACSPSVLCLAEPDAGPADTNVDSE